MTDGTRLPDEMRSELVDAIGEPAFAALAEVLPRLVSHLSGQAGERIAAEIEAAYEADAPGSRFGCCGDCAVKEAVKIARSSRPVVSPENAYCANGLHSIPAGTDCPSCAVVSPEGGQG